MEMERSENHKRKKNSSKLNEFQTKYKSLYIKVQESQTTQSKFQASKNLLNVFNTQASKTYLHKKQDANQIDDFQQSQQMFFKQLNKMCEGHDQFQLNKAQQQKKKEKNKQLKQNQLKEENLQKQLVNGQKALKRIKRCKKQNLKFVELPDFRKILKGCAVGYAINSTSSTIKHEINRCKHKIQKQQVRLEFQKQNLGKKYFLKNQLLKQEIKQLKRKAKVLYKLQFDDLETKNQQVSLQNTNKLFQPVSFHQIQCLGKQNTQSKQNFSSNDNEYNCFIPSYLLRCKQKLRPFSVGFNKASAKRSEKGHKSYFRV